LRPWAGSGGRESGAGTDRRRDLCRAPARAQNQETQAAGSEACASPRFYRHGPATTGVIPGIPKSLTGDGLGGRGSWATLWIPVFGSLSQIPPSAAASQVPCSSETLLGKVGCGGTGPAPSTASAVFGAGTRITCGLEACGVVTSSNG